MLLSDDRQRFVRFLIAYKFCNTAVIVAHIAISHIVSVDAVNTRIVWFARNDVIVAAVTVAATQCG
jgi:hypothetical protein